MHVDVAASAGPEIELHQRPIWLPKYGHVMAHSTVPDPFSQGRRQIMEDAASKLLKVAQHHVHLKTALALRRCLAKGAQGRGGSAFTHA